MKEIKADTIMKQRSENPLLIGHCNFSERIIGKYFILRKSANLPALIFLRLSLLGSTTNITNITRTKSINNYFKLYFNFYPGMIGLLERIVGHHQSISLYLKPGLEKLSLWAKRSNLGFFERIAANLTDSFSGSQVNDFRFPKRLDVLHKRGRAMKQTFYSPLANGKKLDLEMGGMPLVLKHIENISSKSPHASGIRSSFKTGNAAVSGYNSVSEYKSPAVLSHDSALNNMALFNRNKSFLNDTFRRTFVINASHPSQDSGKSVNLTAGGRISFKTGLDDLYFHNRRRVEQEVEEIKKVVIETRETVEKKLLSAHSLKGDMDKYINQHFDLNRISDQVYSKIERRIKAERERRGI